MHLGRGPLPVERGNTSILHIIGFEFGFFCNGKQLSKLRERKDKIQEARLPVCFVLLYRAVTMVWDI